MNTAYIRTIHASVDGDMVKIMIDNCINHLLPGEAHNLAALLKDCANEASEVRWRQHDEQVRESQP